MTLLVTTITKHLHPSFELRRRAQSLAIGGTAVALLGCLVAFSGCKRSMSTDGQAGVTPVAQAANSNAASRYACPMHPEVTSDKPGRCTKCKMDLVPIDQPK